MASSANSTVGGSVDFAATLGQMIGHRADADVHRRIEQAMAMATDGLGPAAAAQAIAAHWAAIWGGHWGFTLTHAQQETWTLATQAHGITAGQALVAMAAGPFAPWCALASDHLIMPQMVARFGLVRMGCRDVEDHLRGVGWILTNRIGIPVQGVAVPLPAGSAERAMLRSAPIAETLQAGTPTAGFDLTPTDDGIAMQEDFYLIGGLQPMTLIGFLQRNRPGVGLRLVGILLRLLVDQIRTLVTSGRDPDHAVIGVVRLASAPGKPLYLTAGWLGTGLAVLGVSGADLVVPLAYAEAERAAATAGGMATLQAQDGTVLTQLPEFLGVEARRQLADLRSQITWWS